MAAIAPNSDVIICKGVPLDISYEHTIFQSSLSSQYTAIHNYAKYTLTAQSYQRASRGYIRVAYEADKLQDCNYLMFRNTSYTYSDGTAKWFYAFITEINYLNDNTSEIKYEIDVMQTYYFDYELGRCFVEREHSLTDYLYESLTDEGLDPGDMIIRDKTYKYFDPVDPSNPAYYAIIYYVPNEKYFQPKVYDSGTTLTPADVSALSFYNVYNFIPMPTFTLAVPITCGSDSVANFTCSGLRHAVRSLIEISASIVTIQMMPTAIANAYNLLTGDNNTNNFRQFGYHSSISLSEGSTFADIHDNYTYTPKNKKLYQYPYSYITLTTGGGESNTYKWELFDHTFNQMPTASFDIVGAVNPDVEVHCYPTDYRKGGSGFSRDLGLTVTDFPRLAWSVDSFQEWWNTNKNSFSLSMITKALGTAAAGAATIATGNPLVGGAAASGVNAIMQSMAGLADTRNAPDTQRGSASGSGVLMVERRMGYTLYDMCITGERAELIDNYFTMYGYAVKALKPVNVRTASAANLRPYWNYIKTANVVVHGNNMDANAERKIENIYNKGITFWMHASDVGDYSKNNAPVI